MKYILIIVIVLLGFFALYKDANTYIVNPEVPDTVEEWIDYYAKKYGADPEEMKKVAMCESGMKVYAVGDGGYAKSIFQYHEATFKRWAKELGKPLDYHNFQHQVELTAWAFSKGDEYKNDWTCAYKTGVL